MGKINFGTLNSANIAVDNSSDESRVYNIKGNMVYQYGVVASVENGIVKKGDDELASFYDWGANNQQVTWRNCPIEEKDDVQSAIDAFVASVKEEAVGNSVTL